MTLQPIIIDEEFRSLIPAMSADSLAQLEASIREDGIKDKLVVWFDTDKYILIDGHHRLDIAARLLLDIRNNVWAFWRYKQFDPNVFRVEDFADRDAAKLWILQNQIGRRNLTDDQRTAVWADIKAQRNKIRKRERAAKGGKGNSSDTWSDKSDSPKQDTLAEIVKESGLPERKIRDFDAVKKASPELANAVRTGETSLRDAKKVVTKNKPSAPPQDGGKQSFLFGTSKQVPTVSDFTAVLTEMFTKLSALNALTKEVGKGVDEPTREQVHALIASLRKISMDAAERADRLEAAIERVAA